MNFAIDPESGQQITAQQYRERWGNKALGAKEDHRPKVRCEFCSQEMHHVAGRTEDSYGHFSHQPKSGYCPTKAPAGLPYGHLTPVNPDPVRAQWIRGQAMAHWRWIYEEVSKRVPAFDPNEFVELVRVADHDGLWGYRNLTLQQVPELFLVIRDFTPATSKHRKYWFRVWFSAAIRNIEDLWITSPESVQLFRASFPAPTGRQKIPKPDEMVRLTPLARVGDVHGNYSKVTDFAIKVISSALKVN